MFTEDQVHFICRRGPTCEGVQDAALSELPFNEHTCLGPRTFKHVPGMYLPAILTHVSAYARRSLSYESDGLKAFRGILSKSQSASYWGVQIFKIDPASQTEIDSTQDRASAAFHRGFALGLCWSTFAGPTGKSPGLPSWSWVSSFYRYVRHWHRLTNMFDDDLWHDEASLESCAEIFLHDPACSEQQSVSAITTSAELGSRVIPEISPYIWIRSLVYNIPVESWAKLRNYVKWDCGGKPTKLEVPLDLILLVRVARCWGWYMVFSTEEDTAYRVGLARLYNWWPDLLGMGYEERTINVG